MYLTWFLKENNLRLFKEKRHKKPENQWFMYKTIEENKILEEI